MPESLTGYLFTVQAAARVFNVRAGLGEYRSWIGRI